MRLLLITILFLISFANNASAQRRGPGGPGVAAAAGGNGGSLGVTPQQPPATRQQAPLSDVERIYKAYGRIAKSRAANQIGAAIRLKAAGQIRVDSPADRWLQGVQNGTQSGFQNDGDFIQLLTKSGVINSEATAALYDRDVNKRAVPSRQLVLLMASQYSSDWLPDVERAWKSHSKLRADEGVAAKKSDFGFISRKNRMAQRYGYRNYEHLDQVYNWVFGLIAAVNQPFFNAQAMEQAQQAGLAVQLDSFAIYPNPSPSGMQVRLDIRVYQLSNPNSSARVANVLYNMQQAADGRWKVVGEQLLNPPAQ